VYGGELGEGETEVLRAAQLARLGPRVGDLVWDIGSGTGAFATEAARCGAAVIAVDRDPNACARTMATARRFGVQLQITHGTAPHILENLPEPDVVRVGGGGAAVVSAVADRRPQRIVAHAATRDAAELIGRDLSEHGYQVECACCSPSSSTPAPGRRRSGASRSCSRENSGGAKRLVEGSGRRWSGGGGKLPDRAL
jgi:precorrin-6Y C5,15-methyltransferase (decarboxylating)